ncbi:MAG: PTS sugar transporter subunit IIA [Opitutaceae bacterium]|nr:PTS sugar transporter subunit IIA [Opitutaceae bacterium]
MTLADFTQTGLIVPHLQGRDATSVIHELSLVLQRTGIVPDMLPFYHAALTREFLLSTDFESGIAYPHARLPGIKSLAFAFGHSDEPFAWSPRFIHPVRLVFLLAVPATDSTNYLPLLSGLARLSADNRLLEALRETHDAARICGIFSQVSLRASLPAEPAAQGAPHPSR